MMRFQSCLMLAALAVIVLMGTGCARVYVAPSPGDLSSVEGLKESDVFDLSVGDRDAFVYHGFEVGNNDLSSVGVSYCNFAFEGGVDFQIQTAEAIKDWEIQPTPMQVQKTGDKTIDVTLDKPGTFILTASLADKGKQFFIVAADGPERNVPKKDDPSVIRLEPGVHRKGQAWDPFEDESKKTLYLAPGAVLEATIKTRDREGITICGRGVMAQAFVPHAREGSKEQEWDADWLGISIRSCKNVWVSGIAVLNSPSYQLEFADCDDVTAKNVKLCGFGERNNDGLHTYSREVLIEDCFIASNDDRICITGLYDEDAAGKDMNYDGSDKLIGCPVEDVVIRNCILYGVERFGGELMLTWNGSDYAREILVENIECLNATDKGLVSARHGGSAKIYDMKIRNVHLWHPKLFDVMVQGNRYQGAGGGSIRDIVLENITIDADPKKVVKQLIGKDAKSNIDNIVLKNVRANGQLITDIAQTSIKTNEFATNIVFKATE